METPLLRLEDITFAYEDQPPAIRDVSVEVHTGDRIAVIGNNGAGKSTFFLCCNGVLRPSRGKVFLRGRQITTGRKDLNLLRQHVGVVFQDPNQQLVGATVEEEISFGPMNLSLSRGEVELRVNEAIRLMALEELRGRPPHFLSGGEKRRLAIADVLAMHPDLILLDEPAAFLDVANTALLERILDDLYAQGKTLMVATHDMDFAYRWATRVLVFSAGALIADDTPGAVFSDTELLGKIRIRPPAVCEMMRMLRAAGVLEDGRDAPVAPEELVQLLAARYGRCNLKEGGMK